jgi:dTDP-4-dehydrorhamnose reductase
MIVFVLGASGMLGTYVKQYLKDTDYEVVGLTRNEMDAADVNVQIRSALASHGAQSGDVVINCIGTIKPQVDKLGDLNAIKVNSLFPHLLAKVCEEKGYKLIHITTDCVFSGAEGNYNEEALHDCTDVYGKTKSLGEPSNCTVVRTSIIGEEFGTTRSLIEWVKSENGNTVNGYLNHQWNGLTCYQVAKVFEDIIANNKYWNGVRHIHSPNSLNKYELVKSIAEAHELDIHVNPTDGPSKCDRSLSTIYDDCESFNIPDIMTQLIEQYENPPKERIT